MSKRFALIPSSRTQANALIERWHRHSGAVRMCLDAVQLVEKASNTVRGAGILGKPLAAILDDGVTLEVRRVATDGTEHACSAILGALARCARRRGALRLVTYTREGETGGSLRAAGWWLDERYHTEFDLTGSRLVRRLAAKPARSWNSPGRPRADRPGDTGRYRWWKLLPEACTVDGALRLGAAAATMGQQTGQPFQFDRPEGHWWAVWREGFDYPNAVQSR